MEINGVPLHPLVIHAVVVFVPLASLAALLMSLPKWRWLARWPALLLTLGATAAAYVATITGEDLKKDRKLDSPLLETHEEWGDRLMIAMWIFAALVIVAFWAWPHVTRLNGGRDREARVAVLEVLALVLVVITGDAGARAVWS
jgi:uncharacterized membrane protein